MPAVIGERLQPPVVGALQMPAELQPDLDQAVQTPTRASNRFLEKLEKWARFVTPFNIVASAGYLTWGLVDFSQNGDENAGLIFGEAGVFLVLAVTSGVIGELARRRRLNIQQRGNAVELNQLGPNLA